MVGRASSDRVSEIAVQTVTWPCLTRRGPILAALITLIREANASAAILADGIARINVEIARRLSRGAILISIGRNSIDGRADEK